MNVIAAILCSICLLASVGPSSAASDPSAEARAAIESANAKFSEAFAVGDGAALAAMYTTDAILFPPGEEMIKGNTAIAQFWTKSHQGGVASATLTTGDVERSGDVAVETGRVVLAIRAAGKPDASASAKYVVVWKRDAGGAWKLHRDIWNDLPAAK